MYDAENTSHSYDYSRFPRWPLQSVRSSFLSLFYWHMLYYYTALLIDRNELYSIWQMYQFGETSRFSFFFKFKIRFLCESDSLSPRKKVREPFGGRRKFQPPRACRIIRTYGRGWVLVASIKSGGFSRAAHFHVSIRFCEMVFPLWVFCEFRASRENVQFSLARVIYRKNNFVRDLLGTSVCLDLMYFFLIFKSRFRDCVQVPYEYLCEFYAYFKYRSVRTTPLLFREHTFFIHTPFQNLDSKIRE